MLCGLVVAFLATAGVMLCLPPVGQTGKNAAALTDKNKQEANAGEMFAARLAVLESGIAKFEALVKSQDQKMAERLGDISQQVQKGKTETDQLAAANLQTVQKGFYELARENQQIKEALRESNLMLVAQGKKANELEAEIHRLQATVLQMQQKLQQPARYYLEAGDGTIWNFKRWPDQP
jgi:hypothetical protein